MIIHIYNRTLDFEILFESYTFQRKAMITYFISMFVFEKGFDSVIR